jgi:hypothetical protein
MQRSLPALILTLPSILGIAVPASACINDREVNAKEREFKSQYQQDTPQRGPEPWYSPPSGNKLIPFAALGTGSFLLIGAGAFCMKRN